MVSTPLLIMLMLLTQFAEPSPVLKNCKGTSCLNREVREAVVTTTTTTTSPWHVKPFSWIAECWFSFIDLLTRDSEQIKILNINVWGLGEKFQLAEDKDERIPAIANHLGKEDYDVVFIQELYYHQDFRLLKEKYPYATYFGSPFSKKCPSVSNLPFRHDLKYFQPQTMDSNGLTVMSKTLLTDVRFVEFKDRVAMLTSNETIREHFVRRGMLRTRTVIEGRQISLINTHLAAWFGEEELWSPVRESQAREVIGVVKEEENVADLVILAGDLNSTPSSPVYRSVISAGLVDSVLEKLGDDAFPTWGYETNTYTGNDTDKRIDYVMYKGLTAAYEVSSAKVLDLKTQIDGEFRSVSDHMGIQIVIQR